MRFDVYGPFDIPKENTIVDEDALNDFWECVESEKEGLATACGCYVFVTSSSGGPKLTPWYVGKAERRTFHKESFSADKMNKYSKVLAKQKRAKPKLFFLPQITNKEKFCKPTNSKRPAIQALESMLIGMAIKKNRKLLNISQTKMLRDLKVSGFLNTTLAKKGSSKKLRDTFDI